jgi:hypothetical protein
MRYMVMIRSTAESESGAAPDPKLVAAMQKSGEEATKAGTLVATGGLAPSSQGRRVYASGGKLTTVDGPFAEIKELICGFGIVEAKSLEEATEGARWLLRTHQEILGPSYEGIVEIRRLMGPEDFA